MKLRIYILVISFSFITVISTNAQTVILSENFSGNALPQGWTITKNPQAVGWQFGNNVQAFEISAGDTFFAPTPNGQMAFDLDINNNDINGYATEDRLITPTLDFSKDSVVHINFDAFFEQYANLEKLTCEASTDNGNTWKILGSVGGSNTQWQKISVVADSLAGKSGVKICFHYSDNGRELIGAALTNITILGWAPSFVPVHKVVFEEITASRCSWCVRGITFQDSIEKVYPNTAITIEVHDSIILGPGDPMVVPAYDSGESKFPNVPYLPNNLVDRIEWSDPNIAFTEYANHINDFAYADIAVNPTFNPSTRLATVQVSGHFATSLSGSYTYALVFTEDSVHGNNNTYSQLNAYSGGSQGVMGNFQNLPDPVPYNQMYYMYVARAILTSYAGKRGSLPDTIAQNSIHNYTFNYTVPAAYNVANMKAIGLLIDNSTGYILNANSSSLIVATGITELKNGAKDVNIFPNPAYNELAVSNLQLASCTKIEIIDLLGRSVSLQTIPANTKQTAIDVSKLMPGVYFVVLHSADGDVVKKFVKE